MLNPFMKTGDPYMLVVGMVGVKMGDQLIQIGCEHGGRLGAIAAKVGLSGRAVALVPDETSARRARKGAAEAGVLVEVDLRAPTSLGANDQAFDIAVVDDTGGLLGARPPSEQVEAVREVARVLRPGGRVLVIGAAPRKGVAGLFGKVPPGADFALTGGAAAALAAHGFKSVRTLAERDGLVFLEAVKPRERTG